VVRGGCGISRGRKEGMGRGGGWGGGGGGGETNSRMLDGKANSCLESFLLPSA